MKPNPYRVVEILKKKLREKKQFYDNRMTNVSDKEIPAHNFYTLKEVGAIALAMDEIPYAKEIFKRGILGFLNSKDIFKEIPGGYLDSTESKWPWYLYLGLGPEKCINMYQMIIDNIEKRMAAYIHEVSINTYKELIGVSILEFLVQDRENLIMHISDLIEISTKYMDIDISNLSRNKYDIYSCLYGRAGALMLKGLSQNSIQDVKSGMNLWSSIGLRLISTHDTPQSIANLRLIILYDLAKSKWPDFFIDTPFIPPSVTKNGYWTKEELEQIKNNKELPSC